MNLFETCLQFHKKNITWPIVNIIFVLVYYPLEMIIFGFLFGKIFSKIGDINKNLNSILLFIGIIIIAYLILETIGYVKERYDAHYFPKMNHDIRLLMIDVIYKKISTNYESINNGEFIGRLLKIPNFLSFFFEQFNRTAMPMALSIIGVCLFFLVMNWKLGVLAIILFSLNILIFFKISQKNIKKAQVKEKDENNLIDEIDDSLHNSFSTITTGRIKQETNRINQKHSNFDILHNDQMKYTANIRYISGIINLTIFSILVTFIIYLYKKNSISNSLTISFIIILIFLLKQIRFNIPRACEIFVFWGTIKENNKYLGSLINDVVKDGYIDNHKIIGKIEFKNVSFNYPKSTQKSLRNVSFTVNPGENIAIIGKNASGKTTIIKLLLGFYKLSEGEILIDGININNIKKEYLRNRISIVHQNVKLFNRTVLENIAFGTKYSVAEIRQKLEALKVMEVFERLPNGLETMTGKYGDKLSGGQKQIIYMLRCYFRENPIILLDEPTAAVDQYHKNFVMEMVRELTKNATCIIVSHDPSIYNSGLFPKKFVIQGGHLKNPVTPSSYSTIL
jgi:ABC-type bacteriocin/lantibiotic exporter with double-glycine peptidase domain